MIQIGAATFLGVLAGMVVAIYQGTLRRTARAGVRVVRRGRRRMLARTHRPVLQPHEGAHSAAWRKAYDPATEDTRAFKAVTP